MFWNDHFLGSDWIINSWISGLSLFYFYCCLVIQSCPAVCDPMDCSPPGSSVPGIFQSRMLDALPFPSPRDLPDSGIEHPSPALQVDSYHWATWEALLMQYLFNARIEVPLTELFLYMQLMVVILLKEYTLGNRLKKNDK